MVFRSQSTARRLSTVCSPSRIPVMVNLV
jgi:hypothetical protein